MRAYFLGIGSVVLAMALLFATVGVMRGEAGGSNKVCKSGLEAGATQAPQTRECELVPRATCVALPGNWRLTCPL